MRINPVSQHSVHTGNSLAEKTASISGFQQPSLLDLPPHQRPEGRQSNPIPHRFSTPLQESLKKMPPLAAHIQSIGLVAPERAHRHAWRLIAALLKEV